MMASCLARRVFAHSVRPAARVSLRSSARRYASTNAHQAVKESSDMPWIIGSALVFGSISAYLLTSQAKDKAKHSAEHPHAKTAGLNEVPKEPAPAPSEVKDSTPAIASDSPEEAQASEEASSAASEDGKVHGSPALTDSEGTTASAEEVDASMKQAFKANIPEDAEREEAHEADASSDAPTPTPEPAGKSAPAKAQEGESAAPKEDANEDAAKSE